MGLNHTKIPEGIALRDKRTLRKQKCNRKMDALSRKHQISQGSHRKEQTLSPFRRMFLCLTVWIIAVRCTRLSRFKIPRRAAPLLLITRRSYITWMLVVVGCNIWPNDTGLSLTVLRRIVLCRWRRIDIFARNAILNATGTRPLCAIWCATLGPKKKQTSERQQCSIIRWCTFSFFWRQLTQAMAVFFMLSETH